MNKIIYLKQEVKLGDQIEINGMKMTVSQELVDLNPDKFKVENKTPKYVELLSGWSAEDEFVGEIFDTQQDFQKQFNKFRCIKQSWDWGIVLEGNMEYFKPSTKEAYDRQELLKETKRRYPIGTRFLDANTAPERGIQIVTNHGINSYGDIVWGTNVGDVMNASACLYFDGKYAEIVTPLFTTEDGVGIYEGDDAWYIDNNWNIIKFPNVINYVAPGTHGFKDFSTKEAAQKYINENKVKILEDYEKPLLTFKTPMYVELKELEPKLFYTKVLQLIADDLNDDWKPNWSDGKLKFRIFKRADNHVKPLGYYVTNSCSFIENPVNFKSEELAKKAIEIMGDKLDYIYK